MFFNGVVHTYSHSLNLGYFLKNTQEKIDGEMVGIKHADGTVEWPWVYPST